MHLRREGDILELPTTVNREIYDEIDQLEKTKIEELKYTSFDEKYRIFVFIAGGLLLLEFLMSNTLFRSFI